MFFLQMSGFPGSGKSTLARQISQTTGAVIVDHDISKTAIIKSLSSQGYTMEGKVIGQLSYDVDWSLVDYYLSNGHSLIMDSPCLYSNLLETGLELARKHKKKYKYVECYVEDIELIRNRLKNQERLLSQIEAPSSEEGFYRALINSKKPEEENYIVVDSSKPIAEYLSKGLEYINE
ncbi:MULTISPECIES: AAA family ATPase [Paenibacillus]|uniref:Putative kinase n=1 Tax=Paenibacillus pabuli TaxID=1472 RepID=A0A855Y7M6_9BACL|nr:MULTISPECIES: AAA family ATPase [Paenibacillus]PWW45461.1 putative kinase [Paenibacillus pabuli]PXW11798.1 putative kinase [Paenibacillus taichungensis]